MLSPETIALGIFGLLGLTGLGGMLVAVRRGKSIKVRITRDGWITAFALFAMTRGILLGQMEWFVGGGAMLGGIPVLRGTIDAAADVKKGDGA